MKNYLKFLSVAALAAAGLVGCSTSEVVPPDGDGGSGSGPVVGADSKPTYASFKLGVSGSDAATRSVDPATGEVATPAVSDYRVLIFRNDNTLEIDTAKTISGTDSTITIALYSGVKKIFVFVNTATSTMGVPAKGSAFDNYSQLNPAFVLGTATPIGQSLPNLSALYTTTGSKFVYASTVKEAITTIAPGVSAAESQATNNGNYINVYVERPVAKVAITKNETSGPTIGTINGKIITQDSAGVVVTGSVQYRLGNLLSAVYPFQNYDASNLLVTPYNDLVPTTDPLTNPAPNYYARYVGTGSTNAYILVANRSGAPAASAYYYIPENAPKTKYKGTTTYAEVEAVFLPTKGHFINANDNTGVVVGYNESTTAFAPVPATTDLSTASDLYRFTKTGYLGFPVETLIGGTNALALAKKVVYHILNPTIAPKSSLTDGAYTAITDDQVKLYFDKYAGGKAYYRLSIGEQAGVTTDMTVKRNYYYDCTITGFLKLGVSTPAQLHEPETEILEGPTALTIHVIIRNWEGKEVSVII